MRMLRPNDPILTDREVGEAPHVHVRQSGHRSRNPIHLESNTHRIGPAGFEPFNNFMFVESERAARDSDWSGKSRVAATKAPKGGFRDVAQHLKDS